MVNTGYRGGWFRVFSIHDVAAYDSLVFNYPFEFSTNEQTKIASFLAKHSQRHLESLRFSL